MKGVLLAALAMAAMAFAQEAEKGYESIPVEMPEIIIPQPKAGKAHMPVMKAACLASFPYTFYALPTTLDADELPASAAMVAGIGTIPEGLSGECVYVFDTRGVDVTIGGVSLAALAAGNASAAASNVKVVRVTVANVAAPSVYSPETRIRAWMDFREKTLPMFRDQRMAAYDTGLTPFNEALLEWLEIYRTYGAAQIARVPLPEDIRMIAEVRCPKDGAERICLKSNLAFYAAQGYTSALLAIYGGESNADLRNTVAEIRAAGMKVWFAFSGRESLHDTLFVPPRDIDRCFSMVAPSAEGMLLGWRRTSVHLFLMDAEYGNFLMATARKHNPKLAILGEGYYGQTAVSDHRTNHLTYNMPPNVSGCEIIGAGYSNVNAAMAVNNLFRAVKSMPHVAVVLGDRPYYATRNGNGKSFAENLDIKQRIERRFLEAGCIGTITLHGDGSDGIYDKGATDNMCISPCR